MRVGAAGLWILVIVLTALLSSCATVGSPDTVTQGKHSGITTPGTAHGRQGTVKSPGTVTQGKQSTAKPPDTEAQDKQNTAGLPDTVARVKQSVVAVGTYEKTRRPPAVLLGTGFAVGNGRRVVTNAHVLPETLDSEHGERFVVFFRRGQRVEVRGARRLAVDAAHDLALLAIDGSPLPPLQLGDSSRVREGELYAFTGFPIGAVLGLYPATSRAIVAAIVPFATPAVYSTQLNAAMIRRIRNNFRVFQLDAIAYPGNSGSPLYDPDTGAIVGVINSVFVKGSKETLLEHPSGIAYAIPSIYIRRLLNTVAANDGGEPPHRADHRANPATGR